LSVWGDIQAQNLPPKFIFTALKIVIKDIVTTAILVAEAILAKSFAEA